MLFRSIKIINMYNIPCEHTAHQVAVLDIQYLLPFFVTLMFKKNNNFYFKQFSKAKI